MTRWTTHHIPDQSGRTAVITTADRAGPSLDAVGTHPDDRVHRVLDGDGASRRPS